jgi:ABC-2 type transport system ATP-binding protein
VFGLLGPNGAGKTTLVKLLLAIAFPTSGRATVLGCRPGDVRAKARIGYLPESHRYPPHLTADQVLHHFGRLSGIPAPERARRVDELLRRVRLEEWRRTRVSKFSKGMLQRLGLAQALLNRPDLVILDEPTEGLDPIGRREIRDLLLEEKRRGATIFLNSHLLSEVERVCDRVGILRDGRLVREGSVEDLTRPSGAYQIEVRGLGPELLRLLQESFPGLRNLDGRLELAGEQKDLNALIDALRGHGLEVTAILPRRESLEEVFVKVVAEGETA